MDAGLTPSHHSANVSSPNVAAGVLGEREKPRSHSRLESLLEKLTAGNPGHPPKWTSPY